MVLVDNPSEQPSALPPPLAPWPYSDDDDDSDDEDEDGETATRKKKEDDEPDGPQKWSLTMWRLWNPEGTPIAELPPVAAAALADAIAAAGQSPSLVIADLRAELAEGIDAGGLTEEAAAREEASIARLEAELCGGAVPADKCCKCRVHPREAKRRLDRAQRAARRLELNQERGRQLVDDVHEARRGVGRHRDRRPEWEGRGDAGDRQHKAGNAHDACKRRDEENRLMCTKHNS